MSRDCRVEVETHLNLKGRKKFSTDHPYSNKVSTIIYNVRGVQLEQNYVRATISEKTVQGNALHRVKEHHFLVCERILS